MEKLTIIFQIEDKFENEDFPFMKFESDSPQEIKFETRGSDFWADGESRDNCNPENILSENAPDSHYRVDQVIKKSLKYYQ